jgi:hypothetical protein
MRPHRTRSRFSVNPGLGTSDCAAADHTTKVTKHALKDRRIMFPPPALVDDGQSRRQERIGCNNDFAPNGGLSAGDGRQGSMKLAGADRVRELNEDMAGGR